MVGQSYYSVKIEFRQLDMMVCVCDYNLMSCICRTDMSTTAFIEPLPVVEFVAQVLGKDVSSRPLSDADRVKVQILHKWIKLIVL